MRVHSEHRNGFLNDCERELPKVKKISLGKDVLFSILDLLNPETIKIELLILGFLPKD